MTTQCGRAHFEKKYLTLIRLIFAELSYIILCNNSSEMIIWRQNSLTFESPANEWKSLRQRLLEKGGGAGDTQETKVGERDLSHVSFISPRQLCDLCEAVADFSCFSVVSPEKQVHKISTRAPCKFQRRSQQALNEVSECHNSCVSCKTKQN